MMMTKRGRETSRRKLRLRNVDVPGHCSVADSAAAAAALVDDPINGAFHKTYCPPSGRLLLLLLPHWPLIKPYNPSGRWRGLLLLRLMGAASEVALAVLVGAVENTIRDFSFHYLDCLVVVGGGGGDCRISFRPLLVPLLQSCLLLRRLLLPLR